MCRDSKLKSEETNHEHSTFDIIAALVCFNGWILMFIVPLLAFVFGAIYCPMSFGLLVVLPYVTTVLYRRDELYDGRKWRYFTENYYPIRVIHSYLSFSIAEPPKELLEAERKPDAQFILGVFPHGVASDFRVAMELDLPKALPNVGVKVFTLAASVIFRLPGVREMVLWTGCIDARRSVAERALSKGNSLLILPGGEMEQLLTRQGEEAVYLSKRKGFVKLAMRKKVPLVPVYVFGNADLFKTSRSFFRLRFWLVKNLGICIPLATGLFGTSTPFPVKVTAVMGKPLYFDMEGDEPTPEELDYAHKCFCDELEQLFDANKARFNYGNRKLKFH